MAGSSTAPIAYLDMRGNVSKEDWNAAWVSASGSYLKLNQSTPQTVDSGVPVFASGMDIGTASDTQIIYDDGGITKGSANMTYDSSAGGIVHFAGTSSAGAVVGGQIDIYGGTDSSYCGDIVITGGSGAAGANPAGWISLILGEGTGGEQGGYVYITPAHTSNIGLIVDGSINALTRLNGAWPLGMCSVVSVSAKALGGVGGDAVQSETTPLSSFYQVITDTATINADASETTAQNIYGIYFANNYINTIQGGPGLAGKDISLATYGGIFYDGLDLLSSGGPNTTVTAQPAAGQQYVRASNGVIGIISVEETLDNATLDSKFTYIGGDFQVNPHVHVTNANDIDVTMYGVKGQASAGNVNAGGGTNVGVVYGGHFTGSDGATYNFGIYAEGATAAGLFNGILMPSSDASFDLGVSSVYRFLNGYFSGTVDSGSFTIGANTLDTNEWAFLDGQDQTVATTSSPSFVDVTATGTVECEQINSTDDADIAGTITVGDLVTDTGGITLLGGQAIKPSVNSTTALKIQDAAGTSNMMTVDTTNRRFQFSNVSLDTTVPAAFPTYIVIQDGSWMFARYSTTTAGAQITTRAAKGTPSAPTAMLVNEQLNGFGTVVWCSGATPAWSTGGNTAFWSIYAAENQTLTAQGSYHAWATTHLLTAGTGTRHIHMFLTPAGTLWLGEADNTPDIATDFADGISKLHIDMGNGVASDMRFTAGTTTGRTATDGFSIGIEADGDSHIRQYENLPLYFYTNNALRMTIEASGAVHVDTSIDINGNNLIATRYKQTEIDFSTTPIDASGFVIVDAEVTPASIIVGSVAYDAPTGKDLDEMEFDNFDLRFSAGSGQFTLYAKSLEGYVADKFKINYAYNVV